MSQHYEYLDAINPKDGSKFAVKISHKRMQTVAYRGKGHVLEMAYVLPKVLTEPKAIFEGLCRDKDEPKHDYSSGWLCYVGKPSIAYKSDGTQVEPWQNEVYLAFVNDDNVVYNWRWEKADSKNLDMPKGYKKRFKRKAL